MQEVEGSIPFASTISVSFEPFPGEFDCIKA